MRCICDPRHPPKGARNQNMPYQQALEREVERLGERYGFGAVMQTAQWLWQDRDPIGALMVGTAVGLLRGPNVDDPVTFVSNLYDALSDEAESAEEKRQRLTEAGIDVDGLLTEARKLIDRAGR